MLELCPQVGGSVSKFQLQKDGVAIDLFRPYDGSLPPAPLNMASFPLTPYSNRIINGKLSVEGTSYEVGPLHPTEPHQLHGDGWLLPWTLTKADGPSAVLQLATEKMARTPYVYEAKQVFILENNRLEIAMEVTNRSGITLPFGLGHHPYFVKNDETILQAMLPKVWRSKNIVPQSCVETPGIWDFRTGLRMSDAQFGPPSQGVQGKDLLDHCFQGWDRRADIIWPDKGLRLVMTADPVFANFVIYIPANNNFFCAEPVTNINDGFNLKEKGVQDTGTILLKDGEALHGRMWFEVGEA